VVKKTSKSLVRPRWSKVFADLWDDKTRTLLVVASIAVGAFAIGTIANAYLMLSEDMDVSYASVNPANITVVTDPFDKGFLESVRKVEGVADAEGRHVLGATVILGGEPGKHLELIAIDDYAGSRINLLESKDGRSIPDDGELLLGFDALNDPDYRIGDVLSVEPVRGSVRQMAVVGVVVDQSAGQGPGEPPRAYVTHDSLEWLGEHPLYDRLIVTVDGDSNDMMHIKAVADAIEGKLERSGRQVYRTSTAQSAEHPMGSLLQAILGIFGTLGLLVMLLSVSLIFNTLNTLLTQNLRQIGVMKLVGARSLQILAMYLVLILFFGILALFVAAPFGALAGYGLARFIAGMLNANLQGFRVIPVVVLIQLAIALLVPLAAGFAPVNRGSRTTVRRAISNDRPGDGQAASGLWNRLGGRWQWLSRPILLSIRNTFRRRGRLILTLFTLAVSGAIFITVFNVRVSMQAHTDQMVRFFMADIVVSFEHPYRVSTVERVVLQVPGVESLEAWSATLAEVLDHNDQVIEYLQIIAPPIGSDLIDPNLSEGRWFLQGDGNAIVASEAIKSTYPDAKPGDKLRLRIVGGDENEWTLVGLFSFPDFVGDPFAYIPLESLDGSGTMPLRTSSFRLVTSDQSTAGRIRIGASLEEHLRERGFNVGSIQTGDDLSERSVQTLGILTALLLIMALLTAIVGSIGLTGTMGMNVLERRREIGVMRAIGAVDAAIIESVVVEGAFIGLISWIFAAPLSYPISKLLLSIISRSTGIGDIALASTSTGMALWLGMVLVLSALASVWPARNAARLTIREVLAYE